MLKRLSLLPLLTLCGLLGTTLPARPQALTPYVLPLDYDLMTEQGLFLANQAQPERPDQETGRDEGDDGRGFQKPRRNDADESDAQKRYGGQDGEDV
ncbi:hypothetical protein VB780_14150 [Leptolyngbya sp. CCNP1308]|uniref:hypothetical protein n=1 Tax=Leptolyngbya sp. CCNP1308 TaxID=3110255 RepID=UPI002B220FFC|nr:hypothetical protein [Leptolyngbya sp. CCNP1308]MEA5449720.1 hypothetical protein [Leptolyngbya sp. CCNP1308]